MTPVESYLADLCAVRGTGTPETSGYIALANLLNEVGGALKPKVTTVIHPANGDKGIPDGGFFLANDGQGGVVMPDPGDVRDGTRGGGFVDIHLNATTRWRDLPAAVWSYTLGGYQVLKKWLSYREAVLLHRPLTADEALDFTKHVRRIAALLALHTDLDAHYRRAVSR